MGIALFEEVGPGRHDQVDAVKLRLAGLRELFRAANEAEDLKRHLARLADHIDEFLSSYGLLMEQLQPERLAALSPEEIVVLGRSLAAEAGKLEAVWSGLSRIAPDPSIAVQR